MLRKPKLLFRISRKSKPRIVDGITIPVALEAILADTLTERGFEQWLKSRNRCLKRKTPLWHLKKGNCELVLQAAHAYAEGSYV